MSITPAAKAALDRVTDPLEPLLNEADLLIDTAKTELVEGDGGAVVDCLEQLRELLGRIEGSPAAQPEQSQRQ